jgi:transcriptional regulator with XRE-family HTH domain
MKRSNRKKSMRPRKEVDTSSYTGRFAVRLRMLREKAGYTVEELAEVTGIPKNTLWNWEGAKRSPSIEQLPQVADALGVTVRTLMPVK